MMSGMVNKRIAVVRGPGGLPGLDVHAGAWLAMDDLGIKPAWVSGCSAGAIASAMQAAGMDGLGFAEILQGLRTSDVVVKRHLWKTRAYWLDAIADPEPIERLLAQYLPVSFEELGIPLEVSATAMGYADCSGRLNGCSREGAAWPKRFRSGDCLRAAVQASMSIAGFWPYMRVAGMEYSDGGTTEPYPLPRDHMNYDYVIVMDPVRTTPFRDRDRNIISRLRWNVEALASQAALIIQQVPQANRIWIELDMGPGSTLQFDHELIQSTRDHVRETLRRSLA